MIPVNRPLLDGNEKAYLIECIDTGWISSEGPFVSRLEKQFTEFCGRRHGVAVCNGSAALDLAVAALKLEQGDEVILPAFTIISCVQAILRSGARPVVVDCDATTWNMDVAAVEKGITPATRAIMVVHIYGLPCDMDPILELAKHHGLAVIEDAAEAHGQTYKGRPCGGFGDLSTFSFYPNKLVTTGEGGLVLADDDTLAARLGSMRNLCFGARQRFVHEELGWNMRMSNMQAAVGCAQFERLPAFVERKREIGRRYDRLLANAPHIGIPCRATAYAENCYWVYGIVLDEDFPADARAMMGRLAERGIGTRPFFWPIHEQPVLKRMGLFANDHHPVSERIARRGFYIPSGLATTEEEQATVASELRALLDTA